MAFAGVVLLLGMLAAHAPTAAEQSAGEACFSTGIGLLAWAVLSCLVVAFLGGAVLAAGRAPAVAYAVLLGGLSVAAALGYWMGAEASGCLSLSTDHPDYPMIIGVIGLVAASISIAVGYLVGRIARRISRAVRGS